ncbi:MAG: hypothetical protein ABIZ80_04940, partial [Bryobacteraceae bacterium]
AFRGPATDGVMVHHPMGGIASGTTSRMQLRTRAVRVNDTAAAEDVIVNTLPLMATPATPINHNAKTEPLGKQIMEGVTVEGTRTTVTIPAGAVGNDLAIDIVSERWFSAELQTLVLSKSNDPRMGETVYKLSNIRREEPARNLFEVPPDYTLKEEQPMFREFKYEKRD